MPRNAAATLVYEELQTRALLKARVVIGEVQKKRDVYSSMMGAAVYSVATGPSL